MLIPVLASVDRSFCAALGEPLRGTTTTHEGGREVAYLIGAVTHRAATHAVLVELDLTQDEVEAALRGSYHRSFPGMGGGPGILGEMRFLLRFVAAGSAGDVLTLGPVQQGRWRPPARDPDTCTVSLALATPETTALATALAPGAQAHLLDLARVAVP
ncbi:hypothetical protein [Deinococcus multiflagellatus]|uniref:Uncharacterized protein n=1 Tax=Deinococcus multiflagellatus TaxID=1656887 RepID=A0ABW1ZTH9_9DEIO|nr:hypothetical protein [Deinococcus multiflagellatus]MBZ9715919.1 hypothetical protein [Deinococcus multiflagellatus]